MDEWWKIAEVAGQMFFARGALAIGEVIANIPLIVEPHEWFGRKKLAAVMAICLDQKN